MLEVREQNHPDTSDFGLSQYVVERAEVGASFLPVHTGFDTKWLDTTVVSWQTYKYRVCPVGGACSNEVQITVGDTQMPSVEITSLEVDYVDGKSNGGVNVGWEGRDLSGTLATYSLTVFDPAGVAVVDEPNIDSAAAGGYYCAWEDQR